jgi:hypothetical protein
MTEPAPTFQIAGEIGREAEQTVHIRLAERYARGVIDPDEVARVAALRLHTFAGDEAASEIFRRCCVTWQVDRELPITSHRPVVGVLFVSVKRLARRLLRFLTEAQLSRQRDFNWNLLLVLRELLERERR